MENLFCLLVFLMSVICSQCSLMEPNIKIERPGEYALPPNIIPEIYNLNFVTDLFAFKFSFKGDEIITVKCEIETTQIVLFAKKLKIYTQEITVQLVATDGSKIDLKIATRQHQILNDLLVIVMEDNLLVDQIYEIYIRFESMPTRSDVHKGYYSIKYGPDTIGNIGKGKKRLAINYFDSVYASRTFPCFDQMNLKAKFKITHVHENSVRGFSTMKLLSSDQNGESKHEVKDIYEDSEPISPFVLAIALAQFTSRRQEKISENIVLEIWADDIKTEDLKFLGDMAVHAFKFYSKLFDVPYALKKLDILIIPYYQTWAQEKYGLIVMNELFLLPPENSSNNELKYNITQDVCQVIGQQWLGTYTTMSWWDEYWFHEALLFFNGIFCVEKAFPGAEELFFRERIINSFIGTLKYDAEITSVPIMQPSKNKFDSVNKFIKNELIEKAHQLFRMMYFFLGKKTFERCVSNYLKKYEFGTTSLDQVWENFTTTANKANIFPDNIKMKNIMDRFVYKSGYPLIDVRINNERNRVTFTQKRFILLDEEEEIGNEDDGWIFPISFIIKKRLKYRSAREPVRDWLVGENFVKTIKYTPLKEDDWILLDFPLGVLCRVQYDDANWIALGKTLLRDEEYKSIDEMYRLRLILDLFELSKIGELKYDIVFHIMMYVRHEMNYFAWNEAMKKFMEFRLYLFGTTAFKWYETYVGKILKPIFTKREFYTINDLALRNQLQLLHKASVVSNSCIFDVENCRVQSLRIFREQFYVFLSGETDLGSLRDIRKTILCEGVRQGDSILWSGLLDMYRMTSSDHDLNSDILEALSCSQNADVLYNYLIWSTGKQISTADSVIVFRSVSHNQLGYKQMKKFFLEEFLYISSFFQSDVSSFQEYFRILFEATMNEDDLIQLNELIDSNKKYLENLGIVVEQYQTQAARNVRWLKQNEKMLSSLFSRMLLTESLLQ